jgi:SAM-dependent methyltransferase
MAKTTVPYEFNPGITHEYFFIRKVLFNAISEHAPKLTGKLMDFGCGSKPYESLFNNIQQYIGVDYNGEGHTHEHETIDVFYDGKTIPFENETFDSVLCSEVFEHLFLLEQNLQEVHRVLKTNGKMLITCPFVWNLHEAPVDYARYTPYALQDIFAKNGFRVLDQAQKGTFVETLVQMTNVYLMGGLFAKYNGKGYYQKTGLYFLKKPIIFLHNAWGYFLNKLLPKRNDLYLINVFLVEKI